MVPVDRMKQVERRQRSGGNVPDHRGDGGFERKRRELTPRKTVLDPYSPSNDDRWKTRISGLRLK
jgi:hypothetical protein